MNYVQLDLPTGCGRVTIMAGLIARVPSMRVVHVTPFRLIHEQLLNHPDLPAACKENIVWHKGFGDIPYLPNDLILLDELQPDRTARILNQLTDTQTYVLSVNPSINPLFAYIR